MAGLLLVAPCACCSLHLHLMRRRRSPSGATVIALRVSTSARRRRSLPRCLEDAWLFARHAPRAVRQRAVGSSSILASLRQTLALLEWWPSPTEGDKRCRQARPLTQAGRLVRARVSGSNALSLNAVPAHSRHAVLTRQRQGRHRPLSRQTTMFGRRQLRLPRSGSFSSPASRGRSTGKPRPSKYILHCFADFYHTSNAEFPHCIAFFCYPIAGTPLTPVKYLSNSMDWLLVLVARPTRRLNADFVK